MDLAAATTQIQTIVGSFSTDALAIMVVILKAIFLPLVVIGAVTLVYRIFVRKAQGR